MIWFRVLKVDVLFVIILLWFLRLVFFEVGYVFRILYNDELKEG